MNVRIKFNGMPILCRTLKIGQEIEVDFQGKTLREFIAQLAERYGEAIQKALLDRNGDLDREIKVALNDTTYLTEGRMETVLHDGDVLSLSAASC